MVSTIETVLKPATREDEEFVNTLTHLTMNEYVTGSWPADEKNWQRYYKENAFDLAKTAIIYHGNNRIGRMTVSRENPEFIKLENIHIVPEYQGKGIVSSLINSVIAEAKEHKKTVRLTVLKNNPARTLYQRLGFKTYHEADQRYHMHVETHNL